MKDEGRCQAANAEYTPFKLASGDTIRVSINVLDEDNARRFVVFGPKRPAVAVARLATDPYPLNRAMIVGHAGLDAAAVAALLDDPEPQVRFAAARRLARQAVSRPAPRS